ncbi:MAG: DUF3775 domain-containing protein [Dongiaceae bacterium]
MLTIPLEKLAFIIEKAREFDVEVAPVNENERTDGDDEDVAGILDETRSNPTYQELVGSIDTLNDDERDEIVALTWLGRGDFSKNEWKSAIEAARERHNGREADYLAGTPLLADYLEEGVSQLGYSLEEFEIGRL